ncbi:hypothetical protein F4859DRAFT_39077 [Xylaria cf. heliscus]|nr:hypothetical protein F4859DRAFT_39077 [Xylaria cf. heliscus]
MAPLLPTLAAHARSILSSAATTHSHAVQTASDRLSQLGPLTARTILLGRDDDDNNGQLDPSVGVTNPNDINNTFIFVLFGLIGVAFVVTGIWFFFWAKNGGFYFKEDDWEDYKSTVLRRKGPNGTILSNATPSTNLGGGSVYKDVDDGATEYTGGLTQMTGDTGDTVSTLTGITAGASDIAGRERRRRAREKKEREHEKKRDRKNRKGQRKVNEDGVLVDEDAEADAKENLRAYRAERPARVGGLNKEAEGSEWEGSTNPEMSTVSGSGSAAASELLLNNRQSTPTSTPTKDKDKDKDKEREREREKRRSRRSTDYRRETATATTTEMSYDTSTSQTQSQAAPSTTSRKAGGIRKVYSTADRTNTRENERLRAEARRLAEKNRSSGGSGAGAGPSSSSTSRRDFSYQRADLRGAASTIAEEQGETGSLMGAAAGGRYLLPAPVEEEASDVVADGSDLGTKSYKHYIPGISSSSAASGSVVGSSTVGSDYTEDRRERRKRRDAERAARATRRE